jgi:hypothetical protein
MTTMTKTVVTRQVLKRRPSTAYCDLEHRGRAPLQQQRLPSMLERRGDKALVAWARYVRSGSLDVGCVPSSSVSPERLRVWLNKAAAEVVQPKIQAPGQALLQALGATAADDGGRRGVNVTTGSETRVARANPWQALDHALDCGYDVQVHETHLRILRLDPMRRTIAWMAYVGVPVKCSQGEAAEIKSRPAAHDLRGFLNRRAADETAQAAEQTRLETEIRQCELDIFAGLDVRVDRARLRKLLRQLACVGKKDAPVQAVGSTSPMRWSGGMSDYGISNKMRENTRDISRILGEIRSIIGERV